MGEIKILSEAEVSAILKRAQDVQRDALPTEAISPYLDSMYLAHTLQALRALLRAYGQHHDYCPTYRNASEACVCGYDVARRRGLGEG